MKKSEALKILGLSDGASDEEIRQAHRKLVIAHHPDTFALDSPERAQAEERTKSINEARDVLINRSWTPEFDPRRDPRPFAGNPYAHPTRSPFGGAGPQGADPFGAWPFGQDRGRATYVWTSWDEPQAGSGEASGDFPFNPFDVFAAFRRAAGTQKTPEQLRAEAAAQLRREAAVVAAKAALLAALAAFGNVASGLFLYVMTSIIYGLWKRLGSCLVGLMIPLAVLGAPLVFVISPRQGAVTVALALAFAVAVFFDASNLRARLRAYRSARRAAS